MSIPYNKRKHKSDGKVATLVNTMVGSYKPYIEFEGSFDEYVVYIDEEKDDWPEDILKEIVSLVSGAAVECASKGYYEDSLWICLDTRGGYDDISDYVVRVDCERPLTDSETTEKAERSRAAKDKEYAKYLRLKKKYEGTDG